MSLTSMTGFAALRASHGSVAWGWELKSVNGKSLDLRLRLPPGFEGLEPELREAARQHLRRGSVQAALQFAAAPAASLRVNEAALEAAIQLAQNLRARLGAPPVTVEALLGLPGVIESGAAETDGEERAALLEAVLASFRAALAELGQARQREGAALASILEGQLVRIASLTQAARECPARAPEAIRRKLDEQLARILSSAPALDEQRLHQEAVLLAARADIQEEIDRLEAHVDAARALIAAPEPAGRKLDFLAQEFNREANTLCSKSSDRDLTAIGLELKAVIDQFREQVQNIE